jgi:hypothetical protein
MVTSSHPSLSSNDGCDDVTMPVAIVLPSSEGHDDIIIHVATVLSSSDRHDDVIMLIATVVHLLKQQPPSIKS